MVCTGQDAKSKYSAKLKIWVKEAGLVIGPKSVLRLDLACKMKMK
jgi:hypothetical protein